MNDLDARLTRLSELARRFPSSPDACMCGHVRRSHALSCQSCTCKGYARLEQDWDDEHHPHIS